MPYLWGLREEPLNELNADINPHWTPFKTLPCESHILICCHLFLFFFPPTIYVLCAIGGYGLPTQLINTDLLYTAGTVFPLYVTAPLSLVRPLPSPLPPPPLEADPPMPVLICNWITFFWSHYSMYPALSVGPGWKRKCILSWYSYEPTN